MSEYVPRYTRLKGFLGTHVVHDRKRRQALVFCYNKDDAEKVVIAMNLLDQHLENLGDLDD